MVLKKNEYREKGERAKEGYRKNINKTAEGKIRWQSTTESKEQF